MKSQISFSRVVNITLGIMMAGSLAVLPYLARPDQAQAKQLIPAANHCAGIGIDAAASTLLAANPELSVVCRFARSLAQHEAAPDGSFVNVAGMRVADSEDNGQRAFEAETARYTGLAAHYAREANIQRAREAEAARYMGLAKSYNRENGLTDSHTLAENPELNSVRFLETGRRIAESTYAAANPEVMTAHRFTTAYNGTGPMQEVETIQRFGLTEYLAAEAEAGLPQPEKISNRGR